MTFGTLHGDAGVGTRGGSEDHAAILGATPAGCRRSPSCRCGHWGGWGCRDGWRFVLAPSVVRSAKTGSRQGHTAPGARRAVLLEFGTRRSPGPCIGEALGLRSWRRSAGSRPRLGDRRLAGRRARAPARPLHPRGCPRAGRRRGLPRRRRRRLSALAELAGRRQSLLGNQVRRRCARPRGTSWARLPPAVSARVSAAASGRWSSATPGSSPARWSRRLRRPARSAAHGAISCQLAASSSQLPVPGSQLSASRQNYYSSRPASLLSSSA